MRHVGGTVGDVVRGFARACDMMSEAIDAGDIREFLERTPAQPGFQGLRNQRVTPN